MSDVTCPPAAPACSSCFQWLWKGWENSLVLQQPAFWWQWGDIRVWVPCLLSAGEEGMWGELRDAGEEGG